MATDERRQTGHSEAKPGASLGVVVLGTSRSGTSAVTRCLVSSGFFAGRKDDLLGASDSNPLGHYEAASVVETNEKLLGALGSRWWAETPPANEQLERGAEFVPRLRAVVDAIIDAAAGTPVAIKDPRINGLLPLWQEVIGGTLHPIMTIRDPLEIAFSLARRDGTPVAHGLAAWEAQTTQALIWLEGREATIAPYRELTTRPELATELVRAAASHLDPAGRNRIEPSAASSALKPDLQREKAGELARREFLTERQAALWEYIEGLPLGDASIQLPGSLREPATAAVAALRKEGERVQLQKSQYETARQLNDANQRGAALEAQVREVRETYRGAEQAAMAAEERARGAEGLARTAAERAEAADRRAAEANRERQDRARIVAEIEQSASWRITAPLRFLAQAVRHIFSR